MSSCESGDDEIKIPVAPYDFHSLAYENLSVAEKEEVEKQKAKYEEEVDEMTRRHVLESRFKRPRRKGRRRPVYRPETEHDVISKSCTFELAVVITFSSTTRYCNGILFIIRLQSTSSVTQLPLCS